MCSLFLHCGKSKNQKYRNEKTAANPPLRIICGHNKMRLIGIEPTHAAPEATALSTELQTHLYYITILFKKLQLLFLFPIFFSDLFYLFSNELPFFSLTYEKIMLKWHLLLIYYKSVKYYY